MQLKATGSDTKILARKLRNKYTFWKAIKNTDLGFCPKESLQLGFLEKKNWDFVPTGLHYICIIYPSRDHVFWSISIHVITICNMYNYIHKDRPMVSRYMDMIIILFQ